MVWFVLFGFVCIVVFPICAVVGWVCVGWFRELIVCVCELCFVSLVFGLGLWLPVGCLVWFDGVCLAGVLMFVLICLM